MGGLILWSLIVAGGFVVGRWEAGLLLACLTILTLLKGAHLITTRRTRL